MVKKISWQKKWSDTATHQRPILGLLVPSTEQHLYSQVIRSNAQNQPQWVDHKKDCRSDAFIVDDRSISSSCIVRNERGGRRMGS